MFFAFLHPIAFFIHLKSRVKRKLLTSSYLCYLGLSTAYISSTRILASLHLP
jgi:hypothetical protein